MRTLTLSEMKVGMKVHFVDSSLNAPGAHVHSTRASVPLDGLEGIVVRIAPEQPGKMITVALKDKHELAHTCDGFAPAKRGVWARPEHLYTPELYAAHKAESEKSAAATAELDAAKKAAADLIQGYDTPDAE